MWARRAFRAPGSEVASEVAELGTEVGGVPCDGSPVVEVGAGVVELLVEAGEVSAGPVDGAGGLAGRPVRGVEGLAVKAAADRAVMAIDERAGLVELGLAAFEGGAGDCPGFVGGSGVSRVPGGVDERSGCGLQQTTLAAAHTVAHTATAVALATVALPGDFPTTSRGLPDRSLAAWEGDRL